MYFELIDSDAPFGAMMKAISDDAGYVHLVRIKSTSEELAQMQIYDTPVMLIAYKGNTLPIRIGEEHTPEMQEDIYLSVMRSCYANEGVAEHSKAIQAYDKGDTADAIKMWSELLGKKHLKQNVHALIGLALCALKEGEKETCLSLVNSAKEARGFKDIYASDKWVSAVFFFVVIYC